jgi:ectoine hydroxylase-related dioxygenase (phytanoyl-CoA dioxygenase family)
MSSKAKPIDAAGTVPWYNKSITPDALDIWSSVKALGLSQHIVDLDILGLTVIPRETFATAQFIDALRSKVLDVAERRFGERLDLNQGGVVGAVQNRSVGQMIRFLLLEDPVFQEALLNPVILTLASYMLGKKAILSALSAVTKAAGGNDLFLHCDNFFMASPFSAIPQSLNLTWALTDYAEDSGPLFYVPGSHKYFRQPRGDEGMDSIKPVLAPAGSLIVWNGNTWHGAYGRTSPGLRLSMIMFMTRPSHRTQERYRERVSREILDRHPPRFATLLGQHMNYGWEEDGPNPDYDPASDAGAHYFD